MEDIRIIELYSARSERAIAETATKYGAYLNKIAFNILHDNMDAEECVSDTYMNVWEAIPPAFPKVFKSFIGKITRNLALDRYEKNTAQKRGGGRVPECLEELAECVGGSSEGAGFTEELEISEILNDFLEGLKPDTRKIFVRRYWYMDSIKEIAEGYSLGESNVKTTLFRVREQLREYLEKEGIAL